MLSGPGGVALGFGTVAGLRGAGVAEPARHQAVPPRPRGRRPRCERGQVRRARGDAPRPSSPGRPGACSSTRAATRSASPSPRTGSRPARRRRLTRSGRRSLRLAVMELWELVAREQVRHTISSYTFGGDRGRLDELAAAFTIDGVLQIEQDDVSTGRDAIVDRLSRVVDDGPSPRPHASPHLRDALPLGHRRRPSRSRATSSSSPTSVPTTGAATATDSCRSRTAGSSPTARSRPTATSKARRSARRNPDRVRSVTAQAGSPRRRWSRVVQCPSCGFPIQTLDLPCPQCEAGSAASTRPRRCTSTRSHFAPAGRSGQTRIASWSC